MNRVLQAVLIAAGAMALSACASSGGMATVPAAADDRMQGERVITDAEYVAAVERAARDRRVEVQWVNPPTKRYAKLSASR